MDGKKDIPDVKAVFRGELDDIPPQESQVVRIFLSSTFTDYSEERNLLFREAIPELRLYCQRKGLDFQVSDMRWGVRDDATSDHQTVKLCLDEIANCQKVSKGPNFVAFLGNRYGSRSYPSTIEAEEFITLLRASRTVSKDTSLLEKWYKRDDNIVPPSYILQPITIYFPHYNDDSDENQDLAEKENNQWNAVNELLQNLFRAAAACAYKYGEFTYEQKEKYFISVTAREVQKGIIKTDRPTQATLCFERDLINIDLQDKKARRFIDLDAGLVDTEAQDLLEDMRQVKVPRVLPRNNIETKTVSWAEGGISSSHIEHVKYLEEFKEDFITKVGELIFKAVEEQHTINTNMSLYKEVLFHSHFCETKTDSFCGREETFNRIKFKLNKIYYKEELLPGGKNDSKYRHMMDKYLDNLPRQTEDLEEEDEEEDHFDKVKGVLKDAGIPVAHELELSTMSVGEESMKLLGCSMLGQYTKPLIIHGSSGTGKSSMMGMIAKLANKWFEYRPVKIIRFLGISSQSRSIREVLKCICEQIWQNYEGSAPPSMVDITQNFAYLVQYFRSLLHTIDTSEKPLLIIIDSIDQLTRDDNPHNMQWLPLLLPANVHIVVSMISEEHGILQAMKSRLRDEDRYVEVPPLPKDTASKILTEWLAKCQRTLTREQREVVLAKLRMCPQPLFLKLMFEQAKEWHSYTTRDQLTLGITTRSLIEQYFIKLEKDHGKILTSKALGYMTVCYSGITDIEMEDILSLDDDVLQDSYIYHLPPDPHTIRLPPLLWVRLKRDLAEYVMEQQESDGKKIVHWFHRQFREAAEKRYVGKDTMTVLHSHLVDYFTGKWHNVVKPLELTKKKVGSYPDCIRGAPAQPMTYANGVYNIRKMTELPLHLIASKRYEDFLSEICYNFEWLYYKCQAMGVSEVKKDLRIALHCIHEEIDAILKQQEEERKRKEKERKRLKGKVPNMEVGTSQVKVTDISSSPDPTSTKETLAEDSVQKQDATNVIPEETDEPVNEPETLPDDEEEDKEPDVLQEGDIFKLTSQAQRTLTELEQLYADIETVYDLISMATSAIAKDYNHLIMQILGTLADDSSLSEGLSHLRSQTARFVDETSIPLLYPRSQCLPSPGGELKSSIDVSLGFPGDDFEQENKISLSQDGRYLYVVERSKTDVKDLKKGLGGDFLYTYDLANGGDQLSLEQMSGQDVKWMELVGGDKYMYLQVYTQRDKHKPKYITLINHLTKQIPLPFTPDTQIIDFSKSGKLCLIVEPHYRRGENEVATQTDSSVLPSIEVAALIDLESQQRTSLKVILGEGESEVSDNDLRNMQIMHGVFSEDEKFVVLAASSGRVYCFLTERGKFMYKWESSDTNTRAMGDDKEKLKRAMTILPNNFLLMPGLSYTSMSSLIMRNLNNGETIKELEGMKYSIGLTEVNNKHTLIATATRDHVVINGEMDKDILVWNIERGELFSRCKNVNPVAALHFIGKDEEYLLSSSYGVKVVKVWYIGTHRKPCAHAMPIHNIIGHSNRVLSIAVSHQHKTLVTASADNTVKLWSLEKIVDKCDELLNLSHAMGMEGLRNKLMREPTDMPKKPSENASSTTACAITKDSKQVVCATDEGWVLFIDLEAHEYIACHKLEGESVDHMVATSDHRHVVTAGKKQDVIVWDPKTGYVVRKIAPVRQVDCMAESNNILVTGKGGMECYGVLYNLETGAVIRELQGLYGFNKVCITCDATKVISTFFEYPMIYSVETGQPHTSGQPDCMMASCTCLQLSPCDRFVASGSTDGSVRVMELCTGKYKFRMQHNSSVVSAEFAPDSKTLVTAGFRNILAWSMKTGALLHSMFRHQDFITQLQFACNGRFLVSCSNDKQIIIWDYQNRKSVASFHAHCPISQVHVAKNLAYIIFAPENVNYLAALKPNNVLQQVLKGEERNEVPEPMVQAQAFALSFSSQRAKVKSSTACTIL